MTTPKDIANKIKQDAKKIQDTIKAKTGLDISTKPLDKVAETLLNDCKNEKQENHQTHVKLAATHAHQAIDSIASEFERKCQQKQIMNHAKQEVTALLADAKSKLQALKSEIEGHRANSGAQQNTQQQYGKEAKQPYGKQQPNALNKNQMKGVFGSNLKTPPQYGKKDTPHSQPRNK